MRRRYLEMSDEELHEAIAEACRLAATSPAASGRLADYATEAARRLVAAKRAARVASVAYAKAVGARTFRVVWWLHVAILIWLAAAVAWEANRSYGEPSLPAALAITLGGGVLTVRWVLTGRWRFGPQP